MSEESDKESYKKDLDFYYNMTEEEANQHYKESKRYFDYQKECDKDLYHKYYHEVHKKKDI